MRYSALLLIAVLSVGCKSSSKPAFDEAEWVTQGAAAILPFKKGMKQALVDGVAQGPEQAIAACRLEAPKIAEASNTSELKVGRTSHKLRNAANVPKPWMQPLLDQYLENPNDDKPRAIEIDARTVGYVEPIYLQSLCVTCHGAGMSPSLKEKISALYPNDQATGFAPGDFRGLFWAELRR